MDKIRTPEEISEWLRKKKWIRTFVRNMRDIGAMSKEAVERVLTGYYGANTIASGFVWSRSPQGTEYWHERHKEFINFYYNG